MAEGNQSRGESAPPDNAGRDGIGGHAGRAAAREVFDPKILDRTVIAIPLLDRITRKNAGRGENDEPEPWDVIIDLNLLYPGGRLGARQQVEQLIAQVIAEEPVPRKQGIHVTKSRLSHQYIFARLGARAIQALVRADAAARDSAEVKDSQAQVTEGHAIYRIWPDFPIARLTTKSISTVKADAAHNAFSALGEDITWAVMDSGIDGSHPHFARHRNLELDPPLRHYDFTVLDGHGYPLVDVLRHGTHVAAIIAGARDERDGPMQAETRFRDEADTVRTRVVKLTRISGMAPRCKLVSLKVLDDQGHGAVSNLIAAIETIQEINGYGRRIRIHGVNMSVGYDFEPEWFACGQSPLCVEVDRLVKSGVVVVIAAGNTGYGYAKSAFRGTMAAGMTLTINDPGNAELAITVGATHRDMPHVYGVSYFSSKGPTGDGRLKPDLVAPGEKILSCARGKLQQDAQAHVGGTACDYTEDSGTSMAAPHVSGVIAAFLSVRREFIGQPEVVKKIFLSSAVDLNRDRYFQGHGLIDLMRAIQSV
jgi:serine protease AprX